MKLMHRPAQILYDILSRKRGFVQRQVVLDLERLHPGAKAEELCREFYIKKLEKMFVIFLAGLLLSLFMAIRAAQERQLDQGNMIRRGGVLEEGYDMNLEASYEGCRDSFQIRVNPLLLTGEEITEQYHDFVLKLPDLIRGENRSLEQVTTDLNLQESYEGYPFALEWKSQNIDLVSSSGVIGFTGEEREVLLSAVITYAEYEWEHQLVIKLAPGMYSDEERRHLEMEELLISAENLSREQEYISLPTSFGDDPVIWQKKVDDYSMFLCIGTMLVGVLVYFLSDRDLHEEFEKQKVQMKREYPDIVYKLALYLGAGMTLQGAFQKLGSEYEKKREINKKRSPGYEQILYTCRELKSGVSEISAYEHFGKRTGLQEYIRLSTLVAQNLKKGSSSLLLRLHEEADRALTEKMQAGRKIGEEASTKLLVPMVMMLGVVMVIVILPAFHSIGL